MIKESTMTSFLERTTKTQNTYANACITLKLRTLCNNYVGCYNTRKQPKLEVTNKY